MKAARFTYIFFLFSSAVFSQDIHFSQTYTFPNSSVYTSGVVQKPDSGFVFVASRFQPTALPGFIFTETNKFGDTVSTRQFDFLDTTFYLGLANSLIACNDGNYVQCGTAFDSAFQRDGVVIKFGPNGDTLWMKIIGGDSVDCANSVYEASNGNYWVCGTTNSSGNGQKDFWLVILDANGNIQFDTTYGTYLDEESRCGHFTLDGGFIMSGDRGGVPYAVKLDNAGNVEWTQTYNWYQGFGYVTQLLNATYVMACCTTVTNEDHLAFVFLDTVGAITSASFTGYASYAEIPSCKPIVCDDGIVAAANRFPGYLALLIKMSPHGGIVWQREYNMNGSPQGIYDLQQTSDGGFILAGETRPFTRDAWLIKVDSLGCETANCDAVGISVEMNSEIVSVFPNPASDEINFQFSQHEENRTIILYDQFGSEVWRDESGEKFIHTDVTRLADGMYLYSIVNADGLITFGKFIVVP